MREWWANVYPDRKGRDWYVLGDRFNSSAEAAAERAYQAWCRPAFVLPYRVHVRLKPEGAPRRYASEANRRAWEEDAAGMRQRIRERQEAERRRQREDEERFIFAG